MGFPTSDSNLWFQHFDSPRQIVEELLRAKREAEENIRFIRFLLYTIFEAYNFDFTVDLEKNTIIEARSSPRQSHGSTQATSKRKTQPP